MSKFVQETGQFDERNHVRDAVALRASVFALGRPRTVLVSDLSNGGAQLRGSEFPNMGSEVLLIVGAQRAFATIAWRNQKACGVKFDDPLLNGQLTQFKREEAMALQLLVLSMSEKASG